MAFKYERRDAADVDARATQQGGDYQGFIRDEYKTYSPRKGDNWVRILPPTWEKPHKHYGIDVWVHYSVGPDKASVICSYKQFNKPCCICDARMKLEAKGTANEEELRDLKPGRRVCVWIIDQKEPEKGALIWPMAWTVDRDISKISKDKRTGQVYYIDDPDEGFDVFFDREGEGKLTKYVGFQLARRESSVDDKFLDYVQDHPLPDCLLTRTFDEVLDLYTGGMGAEVSAVERSAREERPSREERPERGRDREEERPARRHIEEPEPTRRSPRDESDERRPARNDRDERDPPRRERDREPREDEQVRRPARDDREEPKREEPRARRRIEEPDEERRPARDDRDPPRRPRDAVDDDEIVHTKDRGRDPEPEAGRSRADAIRDRLRNRN